MRFCDRIRWRSLPEVIEPQTLWNDDFEAFLDSRFGNLSLLIEKTMGTVINRLVRVPASYQ